MFSESFLSNSDANSFPKGVRRRGGLMVFVFNTALYHPNTVGWHTVPAGRLWAINQAFS